MRTSIMNTIGASALVLAANTGSGNGGGRQDEGPKDYRVTIGARNTKEQGETSTFVITADSYKAAWELGREVTRSGTAQFVEDHHKDGAVVLRTERGSTDVPAVKPGAMSVKGVESLQERRSKKDALTVDRMLEVCAERNVRIPAPLQALIDELNQAGPAAPAADAAGDSQAASA